MNTMLHSFIDIFDTVIVDNEEKVKLKNITIPKIQRDYAQGRLDDDIVRVRTRFLSSLYNAIVKEPITLDFIYGDIDDKGTMTPLDGQQRLTTLFLLHWYAAKKESIPEEQYTFLKKFSYETRYSARYFCTDLVSFTPSFQGKISDEIINQAWFPLDWKKDPTISSMLVMIDAIDNRFKNVPDIWSKLENQAITFYFLPIKDMGLTDELYIKMNSRGKPLTLFEHFKAELEREIRAIDEKSGTHVADRIVTSIDQTWTDLLWNYRNSGAGNENDNIIDDEFLRYFKFICDIICYRNDKSPQNYSNDVFDLLHLYFSAENENAPTNIAILESFFNCWCNIDGYDSPKSFLESFMSHKHEPDKIIVDFKNKINIFEDCIHSYSEKSGNIRLFPLNRFVLLYAITIYLQNQDKVTYNDFVRRIRIVNNLIQNSEDEISNRLDRNRIPAILKAVDPIILTGNIDDTIENNFNTYQIQEEQEKIKFLAEHPELSDTLFELEDHTMLEGQIAIIGLENLSYSSRFASLFNCSLDKIDCALMTIGNYAQLERNRRRYQFASKNYLYAWHELFHKSSNIGFENTKEILIKLLATNNSFSNDTLDEIISAYINKCETESLYPFNYYYIKYPLFRPGYYGKLSNDSAKTNPYMFSVMQTQSHWSPNTYMPYLKEADDAHLSREDFGQYLIYSDIYIGCENNAYIVYNNEYDSVINNLVISQNADGIDTEDRIVKLKEYIKQIPDSQSK